MSLEHTIDYEGASWRLVRIERSGAATRRHVYRDDSHRPEVFTVVMQGRGGFVTTRTTIPGVTTSDMGGAVSADSTTEGPYLPDGSYSVIIHSQHPIHTALAIYEPVSDHSRN
jgi:hypothetical protein